MIWVFVVLYALLAAGAGTFIVLFGFGSGGWWRNDVGRNMMALAGVLFALATLVLLSRLVGPLPIWIWIGGLASLDGVIWWQVAILWRKQRERHHQKE